MSASKSVRAALALAAASVAASGCASQSASFKAMSASDHDVAARATTDSALAQEHADAAKRLRDEERAACSGVPDADRDMGPFGREDSVTGIQVIKDHGVFPKGQLQPVGVSVYLRGEAGMTQQWLGRVVTCHMAHLAVVGPEGRHSPLTVPNADVTISSTMVGFRVTITSHNTDVAQSVVERGRELAEASPSKIAWY